MKPMLFNTEMVRALLDGRKSVTRRVVKPRYSDSVFEICQGQLCEASPYIPPRKNGGGTTTHTVRRYVECKPPYRPGDILYVRETWGDYSECQPGGAGYYLYRADYPDGEKHYDADGHKCDLPRWHPSIHMPKEAARLFLRVTDVRVERLQDITYDKAIAEGAKSLNNFVWIWDRTIEKADLPLYGWNANPWVWVIEFERISKEEAMKEVTGK